MSLSRVAGVSPANVSEGGTPGAAGETHAPLEAHSEQEKMDIAFRVIADHMKLEILNKFSCTVGKATAD